MRACEADRCDQGATVDGRWCPRHYVDTEGQLDPPEYALEAPYDWGPEWADAKRYVAKCEQRLATARQIRSEMLARMQRTGMSLADIAEVTGLTRQRIGQLLKEKK